MRGVAYTALRAAGAAERTYTFDGALTTLPRTAYTPGTEVAEATYEFESAATTTGWQRGFQTAEQIYEATGVGQSLGFWDLGIRWASGLITSIGTTAGAVVSTAGETLGITEAAAAAVPEGAGYEAVSGLMSAATRSNNEMLRAVNARIQQRNAMQAAQRARDAAIKVDARNARNAFESITSQMYGVSRIVDKASMVSPSELNQRQRDSKREYEDYLETINASLNEAQRQIEQEEGQREYAQYLDSLNETLPAPGPEERKQPVLHPVHHSGGVPLDTVGEPLVMRSALPNTLISLVIIGGVSYVIYSKLWKR